MDERICTEYVTHTKVQSREQVVVYDPELTNELKWIRMPHLPN